MKAEAYLDKQIALVENYETLYTIAMGQAYKLSSESCSRESVR